MEPTEDLFHLGKDALELTNLAKDPEALPLLKSMRGKYDDELAVLKKNARESYQRYGKLFDRNVAWEEKGKSFKGKHNKKKKE